MNNKGEITASEFFRRERNKKEDRFVGTLPERRKDPQRITPASIMNWAKIIVPEDVLQDRIYFIKVKI